MIYTRDQYLEDSKTDGSGSHRKYYGQFVTASTIARVVNSIGKETLLASRDPHFNDIPLHRWDRLVSMLPGSSSFVQAGDYYTIANGICLAKEAAKQWIEQSKV